MTPLRLPVECGHCGWKGKRATGNVVQCPRCAVEGHVCFAAFQWVKEG